MPKLSDMYPSNYLRAADFEDGDSVLTIKQVEEDSIGQGKDAKDVWVCYFKEEDKGLVLNKTNSNTIATLYGDDTDDWAGKPVTLYATEVQFQDKMVDGHPRPVKPPKVEGPEAVKARPCPRPRATTKTIKDARVPF